MIMPNIAIYRMIKKFNTKGCVNNKLLWEGENFRLDEVILGPSILDSGNKLFKQVVQFEILLNESQIEKLKPVASKSYKKVLFRFCIATRDVIQIDEYPPKLFIQVNDHIIRSSKDRPVNITDALLKRPGGNSIKVIYQRTGITYIGTIFVAHIPKPILWENNAMAMTREASFTKAKIREIFKKENDINVISYGVSLICPLSRKLIKKPCIGGNCSHLECFDLESFYEYNSSKPTWKCPFCQKICSPNDLKIDEFWQEVLTKLPEGCTSVTVSADSSWVPCQSKSEEVVEIID